MTLAAFKARISGILNRGTTLDGEIAEAVLDAIQKIEANSKLRYMHRWVSFTIDSGAADPRLFTPPSFIRSLDFFRLVLNENSDGESKFAYLTKISPMDVESVPNEQPSMFWFDGVDHIVLNSKPAENYNAEIGYWQHTNIAGMQDEDEHWLITNARQYLLQEVLLLMAPYSREDDSTFKQRQILRDEAERTILLAEDDFEQGPAGQISMGIYRG